MKLNIGFFVAIAIAGSVPAFAQPSLSITKSHTGNFTLGQSGATYTVTASNAAGASPTTGTVTVTDNVPLGLTLVSMTGTGWTCVTNTCSRTDALAGGSSYPPITVTVNVGQSASSTTVNHATVSGGGSASATASDSTSVTFPTSPTLSITKTHSGTFAPGQQGTYTVVVSNSASAMATSGNVSVSESLPSGLTLVGLSGPGYSCNVSFGFCSRNDPLNGGSSYPPITVTVSVKPGATSPQVNTVNVIGGGSDGASASDSTIIGSNSSAALSITKTHVGSFAPGQQNATYTIGVSNAAGSGSTTGTVTVTDTVPAGETLVSLAGTGFVCSGNTCTRSDALAPGASYPSITATVNVAANATSPQVNSASVSGGGSATANVSDSTVIGVNSSPVLSISKTHSGNFTTGQTGTYTVTVTNTGAGATSGPVTITETLPPGETLVSMTGTGFTCTSNTCTRSDVLSAGQSFSPITVTVNVAANAASPQVNSVSVSGGGSVTANTTDSTTIAPTGPAIVLPPTTSVDVSGTVVYTVSLSQPAGPNGVFVMLVSSDPTIATLNTPNIFIPAGATSSTNARVNGIKAGSVMITASASGYANATGAVVVGATPGAGTMSFSPANTTIVAPATQTLTLTLSTPAGAGGQTVTLQSSNTAVATVPASVLVPANSTSVSVPVTSVAPGTATITANATPNFGATSAMVTVVSSGGNTSIILQSGVVVNATGSAPFSVSLSAPAPPGGVFITLQSSNPGVAATNTSSVFIPQGATTKGGISVNGFSVGSTTITASAQGLSSTSVGVQVVP